VVVVGLSQSRDASVLAGVAGDVPYEQYPHACCNNMENPHSERQAVLLERIVKNAVSVILHYTIN